MSKNYGVVYVIKFTKTDKIYYETRDYINCIKKWYEYTADEFADDIQMLVIDDVHDTEILLAEAWS